MCVGFGCEDGGSETYGRWSLIEKSEEIIQRTTYMLDLNLDACLRSYLNFLKSFYRLTSAFSGPKGRSIPNAEYERDLSTLTRSSHDWLDIKPCFRFLNPPSTFFY